MSPLWLDELKPEKRKTTVFLDTKSAINSKVDITQVEKLKKY